MTAVDRATARVVDLHERYVALHSEWRSSRAPGLSEQLDALAPEIDAAELELARILESGKALTDDGVLLGKP